MIDTPSCTSKPSLGCTSCQYGDWFRDAVWVFGGDSGPCCTQPNWKVRWNLKMPLSGGAAAILVWKSSKLLSEPLLSKPLLMLHQDCVLNLPQISLPPNQPGFQQGFQPTNHRTSCQSVFATLIIRVGSRKRHSAGSPHFAVCQGEPNSGSPSSTKNMAGAKISEVTFVAVVPCGLWSLGLNGPRDPCTFSIPRDPCLARWQCA